MKEREAIIQRYIDGYNTFAVEQMVAHFDDDIRFENVQSGQVTLLLEGIEAFKQQAETAKAYFSARQQTVQSFQHRDGETEIVIDYKAVLAMDLPNGLKRGQELHLQGKSIFHFAGNKVVQLTDIS